MQGSMMKYNKDKTSCWQENAAKHAAIYSPVGEKQKIFQLNQATSS